MTSPSASPSCEPRYRTLRTESRQTLGGRWASVAESLGKPFLPWQRMVADVAGELIFDEDLRLWRPAYSEVLVTIPRQNGKTTLMLAWVTARLVAWESWDRKPQAVAYTAQTGSDARQKFRDEWVPILQQSDLWPAVRRAYFAADNTGLDMRDGATLKVLNNSATAGHGKVIDAAAMDEIFADTDSSREQAMVPAMTTRHDAQTLMVSTAGDESSTFLYAKQQAGRASVAADERQDIAYFEWSADPDDDPEDPATWWSCMPALGHTVTENKIRQSLKQMAPTDPDWSERKRAFLNIPKRGGGGVVFPSDVWQSNLDVNSEPGNDACLAVEFHPSLSHAAVVVADGSGRVEVATGGPVARADVVPLLKRLAGRWSREVVINTSGPTAFLEGELTDAEVETVPLNAEQWRKACGWAYSHIADGQLSIRPNKFLDDAVAGVLKRPVGDSWVWDRRDADTDITPLVALTLAAYHAATSEPSQAFVVRR